MGPKLNTEELSVEERAQKLVSYLEQKCSLPQDLPHDVRPAALKAEIEKAFLTAENTLKEIEA